jgi:hypothetical protein
MITLKTKKKLIRRIKRGLGIPLDPNSSFFRICPKCSHNFMAETELDEYCCDKCKDDFNNAKKRAKKKQKQQIDEQSTASITETLSPEVFKSKLQTNVEILEQIFNGLPEGMPITFEELDKLRFDFNIYNGKDSLYNIPEPDNCSFVVYGPFRLYRITFETALIVNPQISQSW